jgi:WXXGXW repeat (2 copies)
MKALKQIACVLSLTAGALFLASAQGEAAGVVIGVAPPPPAVEVVPAPPAAGYIWRPGYWGWNGAQYVWVPGAYVVAPYPAAVWVPGHWVARGGGWIWVEGYWRR